VLKALHSLLFVEVDYSFGVCMRSEAMPVGNQILSQFLEVIDLAVKDNPDTSVFIGKRLVPVRRKVNDGEPA
jgi:hypothetical protein